MSARSAGTLSRSAASGRRSGCGRLSSVQRRSSQSGCWRSHVCWYAAYCSGSGFRPYPDLMEDSRDPHRCRFDVASLPSTEARDGAFRTLCRRPARQELLVFGPPVRSLSLSSGEPLLRLEQCLPQVLEALPARRSADGISPLDIFRPARVDQGTIDVGHTRLACQQSGEERRSGCRPVVTTELTWLDLVQSSIEDRMPGSGADQRCVDAAAACPTNEKRRACDQRLDRTQTFEIRADVNAPESPEQIEPENVAALPRATQALARLGSPQLLGRGQVLFSPEAQLPARVVNKPARLPAGVLGREVFSPQPDLVKDWRNQLTGPQLEFARAKAREQGAAHTASCN